jgi:hydrogenase expression/formation protein HypE
MKNYVNPNHLPVGKLPPDLLDQLISKVHIQDPRILLGPGIGLDCAVLDLDTTLLVLKSDPITFATDELGWYAVQINTNDIATTGALPRWFLSTLLLPEGTTSTDLITGIFEGVNSACQMVGASVIGGHTEITYGIDRPILVGTMIGEVERQHLVTPQGACPGDLLLLTKGIPIEATAILARDFTDKLKNYLNPNEIDQARQFLYDPGISVLKDAQIAIQTGHVTAMHDPTEGGLASALWELASASNCSITIDPQTVLIQELSNRICQIMELDPMACIASGALLLTAPVQDATKIQSALKSEGIQCVKIGTIESGPPGVWSSTSAGIKKIPWPNRDEITKLFTN